MNPYSATRTLWQPVLKLQFKLYPSRLFIFSFSPLVGNTKTQEANRMGMKFYLTKQLLGQRQDVILCAEDMLNCDATCNLLKVLEFDFQCQSSAFKLILCDTTFQFKDSMVKLDDGSRLVADVLFKGLLTTYRFTLPLTDNRSVVNAACEIVEHLPHLTKHFC